FAYSDELQELGARYLLMQGICGFKAEAEYFIFGIPDRYWNHVLEQLGRFMAEGMISQWKVFKVNDKTYRTDSAFWIDPAARNVRIAIHEIGQHREVFNGQQYSMFFKHAEHIFRLLFAQLLYLASELLTPQRQPSNAQQKFPCHLPPLRMENIIFDSEYN